MRGKVLSYDPVSGDGMISGDDGQRYVIRRGALDAGSAILRSGHDVDFQVGEGNQAISVFGIGRTGDLGGKSKIVAGVLALLVGSFGIHKFYLGYTGTGILMLVVFLFGFILLGVPSAIIAIISFVEGIIYLVKNDDEFYQTYVLGEKRWF